MTHFLKDCTKKVLKIYKSIVIENFKPVPQCPIRWRPFKVVVKLHKSPLLIANTIKVVVKLHESSLLIANIVKVVVKLHKSPLLIANIVKDTASGLTQFLTTESL